MGVFKEREKRKSCFEKIDIYPVTCERLSSGRSDLEVLDGLIEGGTRIVQLLCVSACKSCLCAFASACQSFIEKCDHFGSFGGNQISALIFSVLALY
jgi:hypothetical protein